MVRLRLRCRRLGIESVDVARRELVLRLGERARIDPRRLAWLLDQPSAQIRVASDQRVFLALRQPGDALAEALGLLELLSPPPGGNGAAEQGSPA